MPPFTLLLITTLVLVLLIFMLTASALRIVPEYKRLVVFRLGRLIGARGPGLVFLLPFVDLAATVDLREQTAPIKADAAVTQDKAIVDVDMTLTYKVVDPIKIVLKLSDMPLAIKTLLCVSSTTPSSSGHTPISCTPATGSALTYSTSCALR